MRTEEDEEANGQKILCRILAVAVRLTCIGKKGEKSMCNRNTKKQKQKKEKKHGMHYVVDIYILSVFGVSCR